MLNFDTLFLDRDGVINKKLEGRYVQNFSEFEFIEGSLEAISELSNLFNRILVVTNQQGISKGIMSSFINSKVSSTRWQRRYIHSKCLSSLTSC